MKYTDGWKYRVEDGFAYRLQCPFTITPMSGRWFELTADGWLLVYPGYAWDGATKFPDFKWIMTPSAIHDALHVAIQQGAIPESQNDLIDKELEIAIEGNVGKRWLLALRGWYVRRGTNLVDERRGSAKLARVLPRLKFEMSLAEYEQINDGQ